MKPKNNIFSRAITFFVIFSFIFSNLSFALADLKIPVTKTLRQTNPGQAAIKRDLQKILGAGPDGSYALERIAPEPSAPPQPASPTGGPEAAELANDILKDIREGNSYPALKLAELIGHSFSSSPEVSKEASLALMDDIIGRLYDMHTAREKEMLTKIIAQIFEYYWHTPGGAKLDEYLKTFALDTEEKLNERAKALTDNIRPIPEIDKVEKIFVFSRGPIGGDINLTSIILQKIRKAAPQAQIVFVGNKNNLEGLFAGVGNITFANFKYDKNKTLAGQIEDSLQAKKVLAENGYKEGMPVIDISSHGLIHGMMPVCHQEDYYYFPMVTPQGKSHGQEIDEESNTLFSTSGKTFAKLYLDNNSVRTADEFYKKLPVGKNVVTIALGVGGDYTKALSEEFEANLVVALIRKGALVLLYRGYGEKEEQRTANVLTVVREKGYKICETNDNLDNINPSEIKEVNLIVPSGGISSFAALVAKSSRYIGYDSMGQHLAAASKVPEVIIYAGCINKRFPELWRPYTDSPVEQVFYNVKDQAPFMNENEALEEVLARYIDEKEAIFLNNDTAKRNGILPSQSVEEFDNQDMNDYGNTVEYYSDIEGIFNDNSQAELLRKNIFKTYDGLIKDRGLSRPGSDGTIETEEITFGNSLKVHATKIKTGTGGEKRFNWITKSKVNHVFRFKDRIYRLATRKTYYTPRHFALGHPTKPQDITSAEDLELFFGFAKVLGPTHEGFFSASGGQSKEAFHAQYIERKTPIWDDWNNNLDNWPATAIKFEDDSLSNISKRIFNVISTFKDINIKYDLLFRFDDGKYKVILFARNGKTKPKDFTKYKDSTFGTLEMAGYLLGVEKPDNLVNDTNFPQAHRKALAELSAPKEIAQRISVLVDKPEQGFLSIVENATVALKEDKTNGRQEGKVIDLRGKTNGKEIILIGDLHGSLDILNKILRDGVEKKLNGDEAILVILGDAVHLAEQAIENYDRNDAGHQKKLNEMGDSIGVLKRIFELKAKYKENVYFLVGNHDNPYFYKTNKPASQNQYLQLALLEQVGEKARKAYLEFLDESPLIFITDGLVVTHGGPVKGEALKLSGNRLLDILKGKEPASEITNDANKKLLSLDLKDVDPKEGWIIGEEGKKKPSEVELNIVTQLLLNMHRGFIPNKKLKYNKKDVGTFLDALGMEGATFVVGHDHDFIRDEQEWDTDPDLTKEDGFFAKPFPSSSPNHYILYSSVRYKGDKLISSGGYAIFKGGKIEFKKLKAVSIAFFDWDGTIVDTAAITYEAFAELYVKLFGGTAEEAMGFYATIDGKTVTEQYSILAELAKQKGVALNMNDVEYGLTFNSIKMRIIDERYEGKVPTIKSSIEAIKRLKAEGFKVYVVSGLSTEFLNKQIAQLDLGDLFDDVYGSPSTPEEKSTMPSSKIAYIRQVLGTTGISVNNAIIVDDTVQGMKIAKELGIVGIGIAKDMGKAEPLRSAGAMTVIGYDQNPDEIVRLVNELLTTAELIKLSFSSSPEVSKEASLALMDDIIGRLYDMHTANEKEILTKIIAQIFEYYRHTPEGAELDKYLKAFGLDTEEQLNARAKYLTTNIRQISKRDGVKKIFVFSRGPIGGDINLTSIILQKIRKAIPQAQIIFMGNKNTLEGLFTKIGNITFADFKYDKNKNLAGQIEDSLQAAVVLKDKDNEYEKGMPVIDISSHGLIHGMMPVCAEDDYYYFPMITPPGKSHGEVIDEQSNIVFSTSGSGKTYASVSIPQEYITAVNNFYAKLPTEKKITTLAFGVGGDYTKALSEDFEQQLVLEIIGKNYLPIVSGGFGKTEEDRTNNLINKVKENGKSVLTIRGDISEVDVPENIDLIVYFGNIATFAALVAKSSYYIGYDSMGQHLAAASKVPEVVVYAGCINKRFPKLWRPYTDSPVEQVFYGLKDQEPFMSEEEALIEVLKDYEKLVSQQIYLEAVLNKFVHDIGNKITPMGITFHFVDMGSYGEIPPELSNRISSLRESIDSFYSSALIASDEKDPQVKLNLFNQLLLNAPQTVNMLEESAQAINHQPLPLTNLKRHSSANGDVTLYADMDMIIKKIQEIKGIFTAQEATENLSFKKLYDFAAAKPTDNQPKVIIAPKELFLDTDSRKIIGLKAALIILSLRKLANGEPEFKVVVPCSYRDEWGKIEAMKLPGVSAQHFPDFNLDGVIPDKAIIGLLNPNKRGNDGIKDFHNVVIITKPLGSSDMSARPLHIDPEVNYLTQHGANVLVPEIPVGEGTVISACKIFHSAVANLNKENNGSVIYIQPVKLPSQFYRQVDEYLKGLAEALEKA